MVGLLLGGREMVVPDYTASMRAAAGRVRRNWFQVAFTRGGGLPEKWRQIGIVYQLFVFAWSKCGEGGEFFQVAFLYGQGYLKSR
ncbi:hypothetical protein A7Q00_12515 [Eikenella halliae]|uniref:Uncharacterized protein n=1 Tax=Eikenella halliae TaxID=1795832 RepID=A0A1B6VRZ1_9NEIS|nr:hypothetical protein A7Q00_12515 [Eikenella halliae]